MKKYSLYIIGFTAALSGGFAADSQESLHRHYAALASKYAEISEKEEKQDDYAASAVGFCAEEMKSTKAKADFYLQPLDRMVGAFDIMMKSTIVQQPMHGGMGMGYPMYGYQEPKPLVHFLSAITERGFVRISFIGNLENQEQIKNALMDLVSYTTTHNIIEPVSADVASLELFINGAVFPTLCRAANAARAFYSEAEAEEAVLRSQAKLTLISSAATPLSAELLNAIKIAKKEKTVLSAIVQKFDEVVEALKKAGRMS